MTGMPIAPLELVDKAAFDELARAHWRKLTTKTMSNSTTLTDLLNGEVTIDANAMSSGRTLRLVAKVVCANTLGSTIALPRFQLTLGGTTLLDTSQPAGGWGSGGQSAWKIVAEITNLNATNSQYSSLHVVGTGGTFISTNNAFTTGVGQYGTGGSGAYLAEALGVNGSAVDTTAACLLALNVRTQTAAASANVSAQLTDAYVEII